MHLTPKSLDLLAVLIENSAHVVSKQQVLDTVWPGQIVDDANLPQHISLLRKALGEREAGASHYIQTFPGKGYQFVHPVEWETSLDPEVIGRSKAGVSSSRSLRTLAATGLVLTLALMAVWIWRGLRGDAGQGRRQSQLQRIPLVREPGAKMHPALSADGRKIAFVWDRPQSQGKCIFVVTQQSQPMLVEGSCGNPSSPAWSPDGERLAYLRHGPETTRLVITVAGKENVLALLHPSFDLVAERMLDWSPDGKWIVTCDKIDPDAPFSLYLISPVTGEKRLVSPKPPGQIVGDVDPRFSPKGDMLAFIRFDHRLRKQVLVVPAHEGGKPRVLAGNLEKTGGVGWTPDGSGVLYSSNQEGDHRLYQATVVDSGKGPGPSPSQLYGGNPLQFSVSARGRALAYVESGDDLNIWRLDLPLQGQPAWIRLVASTGEDSAPQYSPEGAQIAFISDRSGTQQIWVSKADGTDPKQRTHGDLKPGHARWSRDGNQIAFNAHNGVVYTVKAGGGAPQPWPRIPCGMIGFASKPGWLLGTCAGNIAMAPLDGGPPVALTSKGGQNAHLAPGGGRIVYTRSRMKPEIWTVPVQGGTPHLITNHLIPGCFGCWAAGKDGVYYYRTRNPDGAAAIHFVGYDGAGDRFVADVPGHLPRLGTNQLSLSPDERRLLTVQRDSFSSDLYLVQPF